MAMAICLPVASSRILSNGGAKVTGIAVGKIPDEFLLRIARGAVGMRKCRALWRNATTIGVEFVDRLPHAP